MKSEVRASVRSEYAYEINRKKLAELALEEIEDLREEALGGEGEPRLYVLPCRTGMVARWKQVHVDRTLGPGRARLPLVRQVRRYGEVEGLVSHRYSS